MFPGATAGTLDPNTPIATLGSFNEVALVNPLSGVVGTPLLSGLKGLHGLEFVAATPEPATWPMLLLGLGGLAAAAARRKNGGASRHATVD